MRLAYVTSHPIQYQAPLFRLLTQSADVDLTVLFCTDHGVGSSVDPGFQREVRFDVDLLSGYRSRFLTNLAPRPSLRPWGMINPAIFKAVLGHEFDAVVLHGYASATQVAALTVHRHSRTPALLLRGETHGRLPRDRGRRLLKRLVLPRLYSRFDHFLAIGTWNRDFYRRHGVPDERITLAPYSVDNQFFCAATPQREATRSRLGVDVDGAVVFLFVGKFEQKKRPLDVVRAFGHLKNNNCFLFFAGDGPLRNDIEGEIRALGCASRVRVLGFVNQTELPALYSAADALVLSSSDEPWGLVVNEAMASETAVIATDVVGAGPDLVSAETGRIYPAGDLRALAQAMEELAGDPDKLRSMGRAAKARIQRWSLRETSNGIVEGAKVAVARALLQHSR